MAYAMKLTRSCVQCLKMSPKSVKTLFSAGNSWMQQKRGNTFIVERVYPVPPGKDNGLPDPKDVNELHKILRLVEEQTYPEEMSCILTDFVEGLGIRGDIVKVVRDEFHINLFPAGLAVYASPENILEFEEERKAMGIEKAETRLGVFAKMALKELNHMTLDIPMNENTSWTLTKQHIRVAFRAQGVELEEDCIILPAEPVTTFQDLSVEVWVNGLESVRVQAKTVPVSEKYVPAK